PLAHLAAANDKLDRRHQRRALELGDLDALLRATRESHRVSYGLTGADRFMLYGLAMGSGLRAQELASLTPADFELESQPPAVHARAAYTKNRQEVTHPLPADLAASLVDYLAGRPAHRVLWPGAWFRQGAAMLRIDLRAAHIPYRDETGAVADFHA